MKFTYYVLTMETLVTNILIVCENGINLDMHTCIFYLRAPLHSEYKDKSYHPVSSPCIYKLADMQPRVIPVHEVVVSLLAILYTLYA